MDYIDEVNGQLGEKGAKDINEILEANRALLLVANSTKKQKMLSIRL